MIRPGQRVALTNTSGVELQGKVAQISDRGMTLMMRGGPITIDERELVQVQRVGDPLWNGALIGLGAGFGAGLLSMARCDAGLVCGAAAGPVVLAESAIGAGLGIAIDALHSGRTLVFLNRDAAGSATRPQHAVIVSPLVNRSRQGLTVSLRF